MVRGAGFRDGARAGFRCIVRGGGVWGRMSGFAWGMRHRWEGCWESLGSGLCCRL